MFNFQEYFIYLLHTFIVKNPPSLYLSLLLLQLQLEIFLFKQTLESQAAGRHPPSDHPLPLQPSLPDRNVTCLDLNYFFLLHENINLQIILYFWEIYCIPQIYWWQDKMSSCWSFQGISQILVKSDLIKW